MDFFTARGYSMLSPATTATTTTTTTAAGTEAAGGGGWLSSIPILNMFYGDSKPAATTTLPNDHTKDDLALNVLRWELPVLIIAMK